MNETDTYPTITNDCVATLSYEKNRAIDAAYDAGYITEDEAKQLKEYGFASRNAHTSIYLTFEFLYKITKIFISCIERDTFDTIFKLSYLKENGTLVDELNTDIGEEII